jgi:predicted DNA-binding transcriptional regulator YafY
VDTYVQGQFGIWRATAAVHQVEIHFDASVRDYVLTRQMHPSQRTELLGDSAVRMVLELSDLAEVATWVLGFGSQAEVLAPPPLRQRVAAELARAVARYGG